MPQKWEDIQRVSIPYIHDFHITETGERDGLKYSCKPVRWYQLDDLKEIAVCAAIRIYVPEQNE